MPEQIPLMVDAATQELRQFTSDETIPRGQLLSALQVALTGLVTSDASGVLASDTILQALGKLQAQTSNKVDKEAGKQLSTEDYTSAEKAKLSGIAAGTTAIPIACSDETTALTAGTGKVTFRMPYAMTLAAVRASLTTAQTSGGLLTVDINAAGVSILSTKLTLDNTEKTSTTAAAPAVISSASLADDAEITIDIDQIGDGTAKGLKVYLIGVAA